MKFEYMFLNEDDHEKFMEKLNELGAEGWHALSIQFPGGNSHGAYLIRQVPSDAPKEAPKPAADGGEAISQASS